MRKNEIKLREMPNKTLYVES